jgi:hypothetical protein
MNPISIELPRLHTRNEDMPVVVGTVDEWIQRNYTGGPPVVFVIEKQQFDPRSMP